MNQANDISKWLDVLRCPVTQSKLILKNDRLVSIDASLSYPIVDGIAVLLPEAAIPLTDQPKPGERDATPSHPPSTER